MAHKRDTLLAALVAQIVAAGTSCAARVYRGRELAVEDAELPAALVYHGNEASELNDVDSLKLRKLEVTIDLHQATTAVDLNVPGIESALNTLAQEVEDAIESDPTLGASALFFMHVGTELDIAAGEVERGVISLRLDVIYRTQRTNASL